ncbi:hypothetical protein [Sulfobacillus harzensis]|uniref:Uncharacterized protein n=1 Tax=Sulfobacillus harzensis TaxID=2729629 RepID=A0A7Y0L4H9_9FIRM|nr:hypothetical protein [Sulfobacillus harzensis]NMP22526.1 hypothetical protein [Sulfobacillus harzensis]
MATPEEPRRRHVAPAPDRPWYLRLGWVVALGLLALIIGLVVGFVWATTRDYAILAANGREITQLTAEVHGLKHQLALARASEPHGNWWLWWLKAPFARLFLLMHL